jgi:hypothetical protein
MIHHHPGGTWALVRFYSLGLAQDFEVVDAYGSVGIGLGVPENFITQCVGVDSVGVCSHDGSQEKKKEGEEVEQLVEEKAKKSRWLGTALKSRTQSSGYHQNIVEMMRSKSMPGMDTGSTIPASRRDHKCPCSQSSSLMYCVGQHGMPDSAQASPASLELQTQVDISQPVDRFQPSPRTRAFPMIQVAVWINSFEQNAGDAGIRPPPATLSTPDPNQGPAANGQDSTIPNLQRRVIRRKGAEVEFTGPTSMGISKPSLPSRNALHMPKTMPQ